jgi:beta-galactosidase
MKIHWLNKVVLLLLLPVAAFSQQLRHTLLFNDQWKFHAGDEPQAAQVEYKDANWRTLQLPHDWSIEAPFSDQWASATGYLPGGIGWYRKTFTLPAGWKGKNIFIAFDGVYCNSEVWINGHYLDKRPNGFVPFNYELTAYLNASGKNTIAVKADHTKFADARWYTGSGIYRDVHLLAMNPIQIGQYGVAFTTPLVSAATAKAQARITVNNATSSAAQVWVKAVLNDPQGKQVATAQQAVQISKAATAEALLSFTVPRPALWSVDHPSLYTLKVTTLVNGKPTDQWTDLVGFRSIRFDANTGFYLNEKNLKLKGVCVHDDAGVLGVAVPEEVWIRRLEQLKAGGCNSIRMGHNPHAAYLYKLCDRMGFLVMDEAFDEWEYGKNKWIKGWNKGEPGKDGYHEYFNDWAEKDIEAMMLRTRNSPSVIMWSIGNEIDYPNDPYSHEVLSTGRNPQIYGRGYLPDHPPAARLGDLSARLVEAVKSIDTTRPVTAALAGVVMSNTTTYPANLDLVGYNYQEFRYDSDHVAYPNRIIYGSENGMALNAWNAVDNNAYISAQYLWTGIDYMGEAGAWPARSNGAGLLNLGGFPKPEYYFRQSLWSEEPMIYLATGPMGRGGATGGNRRLEANWNKQAGDSASVRCFTNCQEAELFLNDQSIGRKSITAGNRSLTWNLPWTAGVLTVKGYREGKEVSRYSLYTTGPAASIQTMEYQHPLINKHTGLKQIAVRILDAGGNVLHRPGNTITVHVTGKAVLKGIENSSLSDTTDYKADHKQVLDGPVMVYVQPPADGSPFTVSIASPGLKPAMLKFNP